MKKRKQKKHKIYISLMELLTFGIFLLALLTFVFTFCKQSYIAKATLVLWSVQGGIAILSIGQPLVGGCFLFVFILQHILGLIARALFIWYCSITVYKCSNLSRCAEWHKALSQEQKYNDGIFSHKAYFLSTDFFG